DNGGLYEVLSSDEMLEQDLAAERETRRAERGYVAPSAATAFLRLARSPQANETPFTDHDPQTRAYFRELARAPVAKPAKGRATPSGKRRDLAALLASAGIGREDVRLPQLAAGASQRAEPLLIAALRELADTAPEKLAERSEELAYLSNVLLAGASIDGRRLRPLEAVELAVECVSLGLGLARNESATATAVLMTHPCDGLFRLAGARGLLKSLKI
ncbi:MAG TPA: hypothetical protein VEQ58_11950, partial [Polyangiaceae bacterium]|nr:hypothetical protein [Polyangiaceae bacterium]